MAMLQGDSEISRHFANIKNQIDRASKTINISADLVQSAVSMMLEHSYLDDCCNTDSWELEAEEKSLLRRMSWFRIDKLPVEIELDKIGLLGRWQSVLTSAHKQGMKLAVVLVRKQGSASIYIGAYRAGESSVSADQISQSISNFMDGAELRRMGMDGTLSYPVDIQEFRFGGISTGIPSLKGEDSAHYLQTLDRLASGITLDSMPKDYAIIIRADAVSNYEVEKLISRLLDMKSTLLPLSAWTQTTGDKIESISKPIENKTYKVSKVAMLGSLVHKTISFFGKLTPAKPIIEFFDRGKDMIDGIQDGAQMLMFVSKGEGGSRTVTQGSNSTTVSYTDERNKYVISMIDEHIKRLEEGRSLGFWNTGVYVLADDTDTVDTALGMIKAVNSGQKTHLDPIRTYSERSRDGLICRYARNMELLPIPSNAESPFGPLYQYISTPITTAELSIECNLPRKDYTGLRKNVDAVRFSYNPPKLSPEKRCIRLGEVYNEGQPTGIIYELDADAFVRSGLLPGIPGSGKSTTIRTIIHELQRLDVPFLVIDPVKDGFIDMAIAYNDRHKDDPDFEKKRIRIFKPGSRVYRYLDMEQKAFRDVKLDQISINLYQPASYGRADVNLNGHINTISDMLANSLGLVNSLPMLLRETMRKALSGYYGDYIHETNVPAEMFWSVVPMVSDLKEALLDVIQSKTYEDRIKQNFYQCVMNGLDEMESGWKRDLLFADETVNIEELFEYPAVISLSDLGSDDERAFAISVLMQWLRDYRISKYRNCMDYQIALRTHEQLMHLVVIDEAHAVLGKPRPVTSAEEINPGQETARIMKKILSELREYGQGVLVADQFASRLVEDVRKNSNVVMIHQMKSQDECELMGKSISLSEKQTNYIHSLQQGHMIIGYGSHEPCWIKVNKS